MTPLATLLPFVHQRGKFPLALKPIALRVVHCSKNLPDRRQLALELSLIVHLEHLA